MKVFAVGCEYAGTTTLMHQVQDWMRDNLGQTTIIHDHFKLPHASGHPPIETPGTILTEVEKAQVMAMSPKVKEIFTRYALYYHTSSETEASNIVGSLFTGHYIDDLIYGPHYFGYGGPGEPGDRRMEAQTIEQRLMTYTPQIVIVHMKASAETIRQRMKDAPHDHSLIEDADIKFLLRRFEEEFARSSIPNRIVLDTTNSTPESTFQEFLSQAEPFLTEGDRLRMLTKGA